MNENYSSMNKTQSDQNRDNLLFVLISLSN